MVYLDNREALSERNLPWPRQIITPIWPTQFDDWKPGVKVGQHGGHLYTTN